MPNYDFVCTKCGRVFERVVALDNKRAVVCECGYAAFKLPSAPSFTVKGGTPKFHK